MTESRIELDNEALAGAAEYYGTTNTADTVNSALRDVAKIHRRLQAWERLAERAKSGQFDELMDKKKVCW